MARKQTDKVAEDIVRSARAKVVYLRPYFAHAIFALILVEAEDCPTMGVDKWGRCYYNAEWVREHSIDQIATVFLHELGHVLREHHRRAHALGVTWLTHKIANIAQDAEINDDLRDEVEERGDLPHLPPPTNKQLAAASKELGVPVSALPEKVLGPVYPWKLDCEDGDVWEAYYAHLMDNIDEINVVVIGGPPGAGGVDEIDEGGKKLRVVIHQCGSGSHGVPMPWEEKEPGKSKVHGISDADWRDIKRLTAEAIAEQQRSRGNVPAGWQAWADDVLRPQRIAWDQELAGGLRWAINDVAGMVLHSYKRPSRRQQAVPKAIFPSMRRPVPFICLIGDTSGSVSDEELSLIRGVVSDICESLGARIAFLATDAEVHGGVQMAHDGRNIKLLGRGGTDMCVGIDYALTNVRPRPDVIVVATDCATPWPEEAPPVRTIVCAVGCQPDATREELGVPSYAKLIVVVPAETSRKRGVA